MEALRNNSRNFSASRRILPDNHSSSSSGIRPGFLRNQFLTGSAQVSVDSTSSDSSDCSALAGPSNERPGSRPGSPPGSVPGAQAAPTSCFHGPKFKLTHEGDLQLCRLNHSRTVISKILSSKFLRRWETHKIVLGTSEMSSKTVCFIAQEL